MESIIIYGLVCYLLPMMNTDTKWYQYSIASSFHIITDVFLID